MHPTFLSESLLREVLTGIGIDQEKGVLQQLLLSTHSPVRAFSPSQVDFLAPYVSLAFSQATPEEMILFKCPPIDTQSFLVQGTLAVFSPTTLLLTLNDLKGHPTTRSSKMQHSSQKLQTRTSLTFSQQKTTIRVIDTQAFMSVPSSSHWIAIDFQPLESLNTNKTDIQLNQHDPHTISDKKIETPMAIDSLKAELQNLRKKVDQQAKEIRRLQGSSSP